MKFIIAGLALCLSANLLALANELPDLGDASQSAMSPAQEQRLGDGIMAQIRSANGYLDDPEIADYLNTLGYRLVAASPDPGGAYEFFAVSDGAVNAFALPGGYIGVHSGLLLTTQAEGELASVLAHEIAHVSQRHLARMLAVQQRAGLASMAAIAVAILAARSNSQASMAAIAAAQAGTIQAQLNFSREHEREADRVGLQILEKAGFDVHAMPVFFERMQRAARAYGNGAPSYLLTHPLTYERIADIQSRIQNLPFRPAPDSLEFGMVKARVAVLDGNAIDVAANMQAALVDRKFASETALRYGYVLALLRARQPARAREQLGLLLALGKKSPMIDALAAQTLIAAGDFQGGISAYQTALRIHPGRRALVYGYAEALIAGNRATEAIEFLASRTDRRAADARLYELEAQAYAGLGKRMLQHRALAEAQALKGNLPAAIEQLQIAEKSKDGDFYQKSSVEARKKELMGLDLENRQKP
ncbi:MAG: M48 family metalloprotease [Burkholderiales bacterium]